MRLAARRGSPVHRVQPALAESLRDLADDADDLAAIARETLVRLEELAGPDGPRLRERARRLVESLSMLEASVSDAPAGRLPALVAERNRLAGAVRELGCIAAAALVAGDWQSPTFGHSMQPAAGRDLGRVTPCHTDYRRDRHLDAANYEDAWRRAHGLPAGAVVLLTACGMAAATTVLGFLLGERLLDGPAVAGRALYHETKLLLARLLPVPVIWVDEQDTFQVIATIRSVQPAAVFLDSLSNTRDPVLADLERIAPALGSAWLVVDNTGLGPLCRPLELPAANVVVWESLLKLAQHGLDRTNAGLLVARGEGAARLEDYREHLGTNVSDLAALMLPEPDAARLERRLRRHGRNAVLIARALARAGAEVRYPAAGCRGFRGSCLTLELPQAERRPFVREALAEGSRRRVPLHAGSSFGFDVTRLYVTASGAEHGEEFLRIAAGAEHRLAAEAVAATLAAAYGRLSNSATVRPGATSRSPVWTKPSLR